MDTIGSIQGCPGFLAEAGHAHEATENLLMLDIFRTWHWNYREVTDKFRLRHLNLLHRLHCSFFVI